MSRVMVAMLALTVLAACSTPAQTRNGSDTVLIAQQREPRSLNPSFENGASATEWGELLFQYMVKYDDKGNLVGDAATQVPSLANGDISKDGLTVTYHLKTRSSTPRTTCRAATAMIASRALKHRTPAHASYTSRNGSRPFSPSCWHRKASRSCRNTCSLSIRR